MSEASASGGRRGGAPTPAPTPRRRRGRPAKLSTESILDAALALLDREGAEALTMRRLGGELGVEAMSLYRHVADRAALLEALADRLAAEIEPRDGASDWADALRGFAGDLRRSRAAIPPRSRWSACAC